jgi:hypothetical protein
MLIARKAAYVVTCKINKYERERERERERDCVFVIAVVFFGR